MITMAGMPATYADTISGRVIDPEDRPVADVQIYVTEAESQQSIALKSGSDGSFEVDLKPSDTWPQYLGRVIAYKPGFAVTGAVLRKKNNLIRLKKGSKVQGRVVDHNAKPLPDIAVAVVHHGGAWLRDSPLEKKFRTTTAADGTWTFTDVESSASLDVMLDDPRYVRARPAIGGSSSQLIVARPAAVLEGKVRHADGRPAAGVKVMAQGQVRVEGWAVDTSTVDGTYSLTGLPTGVYNVMIDIPSTGDPRETPEWVAAAIEGAVAKEGQTRKLGDLVLIKGALLTGMVTDLETGRPLAGVMIGSHGPDRPASSAAISGATTDANGSYRLRLVPGSSSVYISGKPENYLYPEEGSPYQTRPVVLSEGESKAIDWKLSRGLSLSGIAVDEKGQPLDDVTLGITLQDAPSRWQHRDVSSAAVTDAHGRWQTSGLVAGTARITGDENWEVMAPEGLTLPNDAQIKVVLRPKRYFALSARVTTPDGKPVPGATIDFTVGNPSPGRTYGVGKRSAVSDALGLTVVEKLQREVTVTFLKATKPGFQYLRGGEVEKQGDKWHVTDIVMSPLVSRLEGRVVAANGQPVKGAQVLVPDATPRSERKTDQHGAFALTDLPHGPVTLIASHGDGILVTQKPTTASPTPASPTPASSLTLRLQPAKALPQSDVARAFEIMERIANHPKGSDIVSRGRLALEFIPYDFELAVRLAGGEGAVAGEGAITEEDATMLIDKLSRTDPERTLKWGAPRLTDLQDPRWALVASIAVARTAAEPNPELAAQLYGRAVQLLPDVTAQPEGKMWSLMGAVYLAQLAAKLKNGEARRWLDQAVSQAQQNDQADEILPALAGAIAESDPQLAREVIAQIRNQHARAEAWFQVIVQVAGYDAGTAREMLGEFSRLDAQSEFYRSTATPGMITSIGKADPQAALYLARQVKSSYMRPSALAAAAKSLERKESLVVLREAADAALAHQDPVGEIAKIAAQAYVIDKQTGIELFGMAREIFDWEVPWPFSSSLFQELAELATQYRIVDRVASRVMLETALVRLRQNPAEHQARDVIEVVRAMATIDVERALEIADSFSPDKNPQLYFGTRQAIAKQLLDLSIPSPIMDRSSSSN